MQNGNARCRLRCVTLLHFVAQVFIRQWRRLLGRMNSVRAAGAAVIVVVVVLATIGVENSFQTSNVSTPESTFEAIQSVSSVTTTTTANAAPSFSVEDYGPVITDSQARHLISYNFSLPTSPPAGLQLKEIRGGENLIYLIFSSSTVSPIQSLGGGSMLVTIARDNTSYSTAASTRVVITQYCTTLTSPSVRSTCSSWRNTDTFSQLSGGRTDVQVSKYQGWGNDPATATGQNGFLTWWNTDNGLHFSITSNLPLSSLLGIGESMMSP